MASNFETNIGKRGYTLQSILNVSKSDFYSLDRWRDAKLPPAPKVVGFDCEMFTTQSSREALGRVSIVDYYGRVLLDLYVEPNSQVTDYRTQYSGLTAQALANARSQGKALPVEQVRAKAIAVIGDSIAVGHGITNDIKLLGIERLKTYDTSQVCTGSIDKHMKMFCPTFRHNGHDSVEDAQAAMVLYRTYCE